MMNSSATKSFRASKLSQPELFFGIVSAVGTDLTVVTESLIESLQHKNYEVHRIKISKLLPSLAKSLKYGKLEEEPHIDRINSYIDFGNFIREKLGGDFLSALAMGEIINRRADDGNKLSGRAYIIDQLKTTDELELFRELYGVNFFQISAYSARDVRVDNLSKREAHSNRRTDKNRFRNISESLVVRDEDERDVPHGQKVGKIFQLADLVVNIDVIEDSHSVQNQIERFTNLLFGANGLSPNKSEYGMYLAHSAALRSLDLSRQVGAALFRETGEIATLGSNEVPKADGGTYWADDQYDAREYKLRKDSNDERKEELLNEVMEIILEKDYEVSDAKKKMLSESQFMDALEYGRIVHAEMCAITDAARLGINIKSGTIYCTTFPCHMCAKHIVAAGIKTVFFLEPYPKSLTSDLHSDSVMIEGTSRGSYEGYPSVAFIPFFGVTPRRYREFFFRVKRKQSGKYNDFQESPPQPIISTIVPGYLNREAELFKLTIEKLKNAIL